MTELNDIKTLIDAIGESYQHLPKDAVHTVFGLIANAITVADERAAAASEGVEGEEGVEGKGIESVVEGLKLSPEDVRKIVDATLYHLLVCRVDDASIPPAGLALLSNLTLSEENATIFLERTTPLDSAPFARHFIHLISKFLDHNPQAEPNISSVSASAAVVASSSSYSTTAVDAAAETASVDPWEHVASLLCNLSRLEQGRAVILRQSTGYLPKMITHIRSKNAVRRRGVVASLRRLGCFVFASELLFCLSYLFHLSSLYTSL